MIFLKVTSWQLRIRWKLQRLFEKIGLISIIKNKRKFLSLTDCYKEAICDACNYIKCEEKDFFLLAEKWPTIYPKLWEHTTPSEFYKQWWGEVGYSNICANIKDQFARERVFKAICLYIKPSMKVLDFGAGTGALTFCFKDITKEIHFIDVDNEPARFLRNRIGNFSNLFWHNLSEVDSLPNNYFDFVVCVDVLEHLEKPSSVFIKQIHPKLKINGLLLLTAPWKGGYISHLEEAPTDWYGNGSKFLLKYYRKKFIIQPIDVSGIYKKIENKPLIIT